MRTVNFHIFKLVLGKAEESEIKLPTSVGLQKKQESSRITSILLYWLWQSLELCGSLQTVENSERDGNTRWPKSVCRFKATVGTEHGTTDWFQIGKGVHQGCILSLCLFNFYAENIMRNTGLEEAQAGIKIAGRNINHLRYADDTTLRAETEEEIKTLLMKVKGESESSTFRKLRSWHLVPSLHGK